MKSHTDAINGWLSEVLDLGTPATLSRNRIQFRRSRVHVQSRWQVLASIAAT